MGPTPIEAEFVARVKLIAGLESALDYDPHELPKLPAIAMLFLLPDDTDHQTGPATQVTWRWRIRLYVPLRSKKGSDFRRAQQHFKDLVPAILNVLRDDRSLGGTCEMARLRQLGEEPEFSVEGKYAYFDYMLLAETEET